MNIFVQQTMQISPYFWGVHTRVVPLSSKKLGANTPPLMWALVTAILHTFGLQVSRVLHQCLSLQYQCHSQGCLFLIYRHKIERVVILDKDLEKKTIINVDAKIFRRKNSKRICTITGRAQAKDFIQFSKKPNLQLFCTVWYHLVPSGNSETFSRGLV